MLRHGLILVGFAAACGGKAVIDEAASGAGGAGGASISNSSSGTGTDTFDGIACGSAGECTFSCCVDQSASELYCANDCNLGDIRLLCDGPEDCAGGEACCAGEAGAVCKASCSSDERARCHDDGDCASGECEPLTAGQLDVSLCVR